ncbi:MAG: 50S ribosomal protein L10 [Patescibacteria group bacterium]
MPLKKEKKEEIVKELEGAIRGSKSVVFLNFHGLNATEESKLRRGLKEQSVGYRVARKTLLARALKGKAEGEVPELPGEVAMAYGADEMTPAREIYNFGKGKETALSILGGIFGGKFVGADKMNEIATIPSREVLLSKIAWLLQSPIQRFAVALSEVGKKK